MKKIKGKRIKKWTNYGSKFLKSVKKWMSQKKNSNCKKRDIKS